MGKQVPLVYYRPSNGERVEVGMASVQSNGYITAQVKKDLVPDLDAIFRLDTLEISIARAHTTVDVRSKYVAEPAIAKVVRTEVLVEDPNGG